MTKSDHRKPINFVGMYFIDEHGEDYRTGQIIAQISDGYWLAQFDCTHGSIERKQHQDCGAIDGATVPLPLPQHRRQRPGLGCG
jgi:hypothetical protein